MRRRIRITKLQPSRAGVLLVVMNSCPRTHKPNEPARSKMTRVQKSAVRRHTIPTQIARTRGDVSAYQSVDRCKRDSFSCFFFLDILCVLFVLSARPHLYLLLLHSFLCVVRSLVYENRG